MINTGKQILTVLITILFFILINCGKKGPLKLNPEVQPGKPVETKIVQEGDDLLFSWKFPKFLKDNKTDFNSSSIKKVYIYYSDKPLPENTSVESNTKTKGGVADKTFSSSLFIKKSKLLSKIDPQQIRSDNGVYYFSYPNISKKFLNKDIYFGIRYKYLKTNSDLSDIKNIRIMLPIEPVTNLVLLNENKVIKLNWSSSSKKAKGKKSPVITGFNVFRKIELKDEEKVPAFTKINTDKVLKEYYEDSDTGISGIYNYYVSVSASSSNFSKPSNIVKVTIKDIFPPSVPQNLHIFKSKDGLMLSWKKVNDKDLSKYKIYRREESSADFSLLNSEVKDNRFLDNTVKKGVNYFYYITSVDNNGNESDNSEERSEQF